MKTKVKFTYEFTIEHDTEYALNRAIIELEKNPVFQLMSPIGYSIKITEKSGVCKHEPTR